MNKTNLGRLSTSEVGISVAQKQLFSTRSSIFLFSVLVSLVDSACCVGSVAPRLRIFRKAVDAENEQQPSAQFAEKGLPFRSFLKELGDALPGLDISSKLCELRPDAHKQKRTNLLKYLPEGILVP